MRGTFRLVLLFATVILTGLIAIGFAGSLHPMFDSVGHFRFHFMLLLVPMIVLLWFQGFRRTASTLLLAWAASFVSMRSLAPLTDFGGDSRVHLVQFNSLFKNPTPQAAADWIKTEAPDVVTMQEVSRTSRAIMDALRAELPHQLLCEFATVGGVAVLSRHPIVGSKCVKGEGFAWARLNINGRELTVASLHLHWPWPYGQRQQIERLRPEMQAAPRPVVLAGDFNASPWSAAARDIAEATDTRVVSGLRMTLRIGPPPLGPIRFLPIDHVLIPRDAAFWDVKIGPQIGSDHHPVAVTLGVCCEAQ